MFQLVAIEMPRPYLTPTSVVPAMANEAGPMRAGVLVTIYGRNLGPERGCSAAFRRQAGIA
ncbi:MAG TPA: hypothetical protein VER03_03885 [Bryobacteraceae bacterium]|nr:hypothetical protein [Bryobacteraceae bacterium]